MKFCYLDESGMGSEPVLVMAGIIVDAQRMHVTKEAWGDFLDYCSEKTGKLIPEFHFREFYSGNGPWHSPTMDGPTRAKVINAILEWIGKRKHKVTFSAIQKDRYETQKSTNNVLIDLKSRWCAAAMHCIMSLQKQHQRESKIKGHTVIIFDKETKEEQQLSDLVHTPPDCVQSYCPSIKTDILLDHIIDVPYFADSKPVLLIQVADLVSYVLRRHSELQDAALPEKYTGEKIQVQGWTHMISEVSLPPSSRYPIRGRCATAQTFWDIAPASLRSLG